MNVPFRRGNDGLTDRQRAKYANRWRNGAGRAPSRDEMDEIRRLTPLADWERELLICRTCGASCCSSNCPAHPAAEESA